MRINLFHMVAWCVCFTPVAVSQEVVSTPEDSVEWVVLRAMEGSELSRGRGVGELQFRGRGDCGHDVADTL